MRAIAIVLVVLMAGIVLSASLEKKQNPNIVIIYTDDQGYGDAVYTPSRYSLLTGRYSCLSFKGGKRDIYESGHRVPFLMRWPRVIEAGRKVDILRGSGGSLKSRFIESAAGEAIYELYNMEKDPGETKNLYFQHPEIAKKLTQNITKIVEDSRTTPVTPQFYEKDKWKQLT